MQLDLYELERLTEAMKFLDYQGCGCDDDRADHDNLLGRLEAGLHRLQDS